MKEIKQLINEGFEGFIPVGELFYEKKNIPSHGGDYFVLRLSDEKPEFLEVGTGGLFKRTEMIGFDISLR